MVLGQEGHVWWRGWEGWQGRRREKCTLRIHAGGKLKDQWEVRGRGKRRKQGGPHVLALQISGREGLLEMGEDLGEKRYEKRHQEVGFCGTLVVQ